MQFFFFFFFFFLFLIFFTQRNWIDLFGIRPFVMPCIIFRLLCRPLRPRSLRSNCMNVTMAVYQDQRGLVESHNLYIASPTDLIDCFVCFLAILRWMYVANSNYLIIWQSTVHRSYMWYKPIMFYFIPQHANFFSLSLSLTPQEIKIIILQYLLSDVIMGKMGFYCKKNSKHLQKEFKRLEKLWRHPKIYHIAVPPQRHNKMVIRFLFYCLHLLITIFF